LRLCLELGTAIIQSGRFDVIGFLVHCRIVLRCANGFSSKAVAAELGIHEHTVGRIEEGKLCLFVAIDRTSKFAFAELHERAARSVAAEFLKRLIDAVPYTIHTALTDGANVIVSDKRSQWARTSTER
jgi:hypothetical protein